MEKNMLDLKLSKFVEECLSNGVVPYLKFLDKDKVEVGQSERVSVFEVTPQGVLEREIRTLNLFKKRIETREEIDESAPQERLDEILSQIQGKIEALNAAIALLNKDQGLQECDASKAK